MQESSPTALSAQRSGKISFKSNSPGAARYELLMVTNGGTTKVVAKARRDTGLKPRTPVCERVKLEAVAIIPSAHWMSGPSNVIEYERKPSAKNQTCTRADGRNNPVKTRKGKST